MLSLKKPSPRVLDAFRTVFNNFGHGESMSAALRGHDSRYLEDENDLVALHPPQDDDRLTQFLRTFFPFLFIVSHIPSTQSVPLRPCIKSR